MFASRVPCLVFILLALLMGAATVPAVAQTLPANQRVASRIVLPIDDAVRVTIPYSTHPLATPVYDVGPVDGGTALQRIVLVLQGSADQQYQARTLVDSQHTKGSPNYHRWLTPEQFGQKFGPSAQDIAQVTGWLQKHGFAIGSVARSGLWLEFSGTSAQVESAFQTQMHQYLVNGKLHVANARNVSIPAALSPVVLGALSLHNFYSKPPHRRFKPNANIPIDANNDQIHAIAPSDFYKIYDLNPLFAAATPLNGSGETIAVIEASNINTSDVSTFQTLFGVTPANAPNIILNGPDPGVDTGELGFEASLDTEWAGAVAPGATVDVVVSGGTLTTDPVALGSSFVVDQNLASVMSLSFIECEADTQPVPAFSFWNTVWEQAAAQGISAFVASGDSGAAGCDAAGQAKTAATGPVSVNGFASTPFNTAVGGTEFNETVNGGVDGTFWNETADILSSVNGYIPEMVWNDSCTPSETNTICPELNPAAGQFLLFAGGGGLSQLYSTPSFQNVNAGIPGLTAAVLDGRRGLPDISLDAAVQHDPYIFCFTTEPASPDCQLSGGQITDNTFQSLGGGTSFAAPEFAALIAIVDQKLGERQGLANYVLYPLAAAANPSLTSCNSNNRGNPLTATSCVFNDITTGNNGVPGTDVTNDPTAGALGFPATTGYDLATGLGSVDAANLVNAWGSIKFEGSTTTLTTNPTTVSITHGQPVSVSISVARQSAAEAGTPSGNVSLVAQGGNLPSSVGIAFEPISGGGGTATAGPVNVNNLPGGTAYSLSASFPGDGTFGGSNSNAVTVTVGPENSTTSLQSLVLNDSKDTVTNSATIDYGDPVNILFIDADTAGVSGLIPASGSVTFTAAGLGSTSIPIDNSGIAELIDCSASCLTPGSYTITASYSGDGLSYNGSSSGPLTITVTKGTELPVVTAPATATAGVAFTVQASIPVLAEAVSPTGTIQFMNGTTALGAPVTLTGDLASTQVTLNTGGAQTITAQYSGDANYSAETSAAAIVTVAAPFNFSATTTSQTITAGQTATYNVTLNGVGGFSGQVNFGCTGAPNGATCAVSPNPATLSATTTSVPVTVTVSNTSSARLKLNPFRSLPFVFAGLLGVVVLGLRRNPRHRLVMLVLLGAFLVVGVSSCGGGGGSTPTPTAQTFTLTVTGTSGSLSNTVTLNLTVN